MMPTGHERGRSEHEPVLDLDRARERAAALAADVRRRDRRETLVALLLVPLFLLGAWNAPTALASAGALIVAAAAAFIPLRLRAARRAEPDPGLPAAARLRAELERVRAQEQLLGSVATWYLAPLGLGLALFFAGVTGSVAWRAAVVVLLVVAYAAIWWFNQRAVQRDVAPLVHALEASVRNLERDGETA